MSETKHTPGPWTASKDEVNYIGVPSFEICTGDGPYWVAHALKAEDAKLIAAAPELYRVAYQLAENFAWSGVVADCEELRERLNGLIDELRVAVAKAEGA